jgi:hypothetical protein
MKILAVWLVKKILQNRAESVVGEAEGLYWQYESFLKKWMHLFTQL